MKLHYFQHVPFEGPGSIVQWAASRKYQLTSTRWHLDEQPPPLSDLDWLIVMGGPMSVHDMDKYPWLNVEKEYILRAIEAGKTVIGICLGAQLIASVLGGRITPNPFPEIGWFPVYRSEKSKGNHLGDILPAVMDVFHWHGETFTLPPGGILITSSEACENQGFLLGDRVLGLQFHLEVTAVGVESLLDNCSSDLQTGKYIQTADEMLSDPARFAKANKIMHVILDYLHNRH